jgi:NTE family protein
MMSRVYSRRSWFDLTVLPVFAIFILALLPNESASAQQCVRADIGDRPSIGLALGGGGARGGAHIGVLKMLEELRIPVDYIAGTSMGSIAGGLLAAGLTVDEIETVMLTADWEDLFDDATQREDQPMRRKSDDDLGLFGPKLGVGEDGEVLPRGAVAGQKITFLFESLTSTHIRTKDFDQLPIPFRAVATDIINGKMVVMDKGDLSIAMRSSMSVPGAFDPVRVGEYLLVDGGLVRNLPADIVRDMGAEVVIAVNVGTPLSPEEELGNLISILGQLSSLMIVANTEKQIETLGPSDILISPELGDEIGSADFTEIEKAIPIGYVGAEKVRERLTTLSVTNEEYETWRRGIEACQQDVPVLHFVRLENHSRFGDDIISELITVKPGDTLNIDQLDRDLRQIYGLGFIRSARYRVVEQDGDPGLVIVVQSDPRGSDILETGFDFSTDSKESSLNIRAAHLKLDLDDRGSELRTAIQVGDDLGLLGQYYRPLGPKMKWIFLPEVAASRIDLVSFENQAVPLSEVELTEYGAKVSFGREFGRHAGLFAGIATYSGKAEPSVGKLGIETTRYDGGEWFLTGIYDRLDSRFIPSRGNYGNLRYVKSDENLGADAEFEQVIFNWHGARSWGRHTGSYGTTFKTTLDDNAPIWALFSGGGFVNLSGFEANQLVGQHFGLSMVGYRYQLKQSGLAPGYAGMTLEYGNAADKAGDVYGEGILNASVFLAYDTPLGPLYMGFGVAEDKSGRFFLHMGPVVGAASIGRR